LIHEQRLNPHHATTIHQRLDADRKLDATAIMIAAV
jgi:hypothetical protein